MSEGYFTINGSRIDLQSVKIEIVHDPENDRLQNWLYNANAYPRIAAYAIVDGGPVGEESERLCAGMDQRYGEGTRYALVRDIHDAINHFAHLQLPRPFGAQGSIPALRDACRDERGWCDGSCALGFVPVPEGERTARDIDRAGRLLLTLARRLADAANGVSR